MVDDEFFEIHRDLLRQSRRQFLAILTEFNRAAKIGYKQFSGGGALEAWFLLMALDQAPNGSLHNWETEIALPAKHSKGKKIVLRGNTKGLCERDLAAQDPALGTITITETGRNLAAKIYNHWQQELLISLTPAEMNALAKSQLAFFITRMNELALPGDDISPKRAVQIWYVLSEIVIKTRIIDDWLFAAPYDDVERAISRGIEVAGAKEISGVPETGRSYIAELISRGFIVTVTGTVSLTPRGRELIEDTVSNYIGLVSPMR